MTNLEKKRQMSAEELATFIITNSKCCVCKNFHNCSIEYQFEYDECYKGVKAWLNSEVEE